MPGLASGNMDMILIRSDPGVQIFLKDWIKQYAEIFPSPFIHIGFDETWETERLKIEDPSIKPKELYLEQINFVTKTLRDYGKKVWSGLIFQIIIRISFQHFPKDFIPVLWEYSDESGFIDQMAILLKKKICLFLYNRL